MPGGGKNGFYEYSIDPICNADSILKGPFSEIFLKNKWGYPAHNPSSLKCGHSEQSSALYRESNAGFTAL